MHTPLLSKAFLAEATITKETIVRAGTAKGYLRPASASNQPLFGIANNIGAALGARLDVHTHGFALVKLGGTVVAGDYLTADEDGNAIAASFASAGTVYCIGQAVDAGVEGDLVGVRIAPCAVVNEEGLITLDVTLTTGQLLALFATPVSVIPAAGATKAAVIVDVDAFYDYNSAAYAGIGGTEDLVLRYTDASGSIMATIETTGFLDQTADQIRHVKGVGVTPVANAAVMAHMAVGEITTGNSPVRLRIRYRLIDTAF